MLLIRDQQIHTLQQHHKKIYVDQLIEMLSEKFPHRLQQYKEDNLVDLINCCISICRENEYTSKSEITQFIEDMIEIGADLDLPRDTALKEVLLIFKVKAIYSMQKAMALTKSG